MKRFIFSLLMFFVAVFTTFAQQQKSPDEQIIVNKKFDDQGNLIEYDSMFIHQWSMDTTFHFGFPGDNLSFQYNFPGIEHFMKEFWNDSLFSHFSFPQQPFSFGFQFSPFGDNHFGRTPNTFSDSLFSNHFPFQFDSLFFDFGYGSDNNFPPEFDQKFFDDFEERLNQHFFRFRDENFAFPEFKNEEHREEWEKLIQKHQKELEELQKRWQDNNPPEKKQ